LVAVVGMYTTPTLHMPPAGNEGRQVLLTMKNGGGAVMLVKVIAVVVESLVAVTVIGALVVPTVTVPKLSFLGLTSSPCAFFASAVPPTSVRRSVRVSARIASADNLDRIIFGSS
jgi:hypothetical protein